LRQNYIRFCLFYLGLISCMNEWVSCVDEGHTICRLSLSVSEKLLAGLCVCVCVYLY